MLTEKRQRIILELLKQNNIVTIQELVKETRTSESTIRRDLIQLEEQNALKRIHGGASRLQGKLEEPTMEEKSTKNIQAKKEVAKFSASLIEDGDCIYLDAGTSTLHIIPYLNNHFDITVVTNSLTNLVPLLNKGIKTYVIGGFLKPRTNAMIGEGAIKSIGSYRFDKCFIGVNGIHPTLGFTTPDPEEAALKKKALQLSQESFVLADRSKFGQIAFSEIAPISSATIITNEMTKELLQPYKGKTSVKVVTS